MGICRNDVIYRSDELRHRIRKFVLPSPHILWDDWELGILLVQVLGYREGLADDLVCGWVTNHRERVSIRPVRPLVRRSSAELFQEVLHVAILDPDGFIRDALVVEDKPARDEIEVLASLQEGRLT